MTTKHCLSKKGPSGTQGMDMDEKVTQNMAKEILEDVDNCC